jgi:hypothetical protein
MYGSHSIREIAASTIASRLLDDSGGPVSISLHMEQVIPVSGVVKVESIPARPTEGKLGRILVTSTGWGVGDRSTDHMRVTVLP